MHYIPVKKHVGNDGPRFYYQQTDFCRYSQVSGNIFKAENRCKEKSGYSIYDTYDQK
jgi:hypothetical protein